MNVKTWNSLPADVQKVFNETLYSNPIWWPQVTISQEKVAIDLAIKYGYEIIQLSADEKQKWLDAAKPKYDSWSAEMKAKGLPGAEAIAKVIELMKKISLAKLAYGLRVKTSYRFATSKNL